MTRPLLFAGLAAAVAAAHLAADPATEPYFNNDESRHVMTGVFVRDAVADLPASAAGPKGYAVRYYAQYPALGLLVWPPLFYAVEGAAMAAFGTSYLTARLVLAGFALLAGWYTFRLVTRTHGPWAAAVAVGLLGFSPLAFEYSRRVMLEVPTLALVLGAVFHFERYLGEERPRDALLACVLAALAALTRFDGVLLLPFVAVRLAACRKFRLLARRSVVAGVAVALALTVPYYLFTWKVYGTSIAKGATEGTRPDDTSFLDPRNIGFYPGTLPEQAGWPLTAAAAVGLALGVPRRLGSGLGLSPAERRERPVRHGEPGEGTSSPEPEGETGRGTSSPSPGLRPPSPAAPRGIDNIRRPPGVYVGLAVATYVTFTPLAELETRHAIYWLPAVAVFAVEAVLFAASYRTAFGVAAAVGLLAATAYVSVSRPAWAVAGYADAARFAVERASGERPVMFDGVLAANFVYHVRRADPDRRLWVLRGDKVLYTMHSDPRTAYTELAGSEAEALGLLERYDPEWIVVEAPQLYHPTRGGELLREVLRKNPDRFRLEHAEPLRSNRFPGVRLEVFRKLTRNPNPTPVADVPASGLSR